MVEFILGFVAGAAIAMVVYLLLDILEENK